MLADPVGKATPNTAERSTFPGTGLICHFSAGATSENPEFSRPRRFAKYVGVSTRNSRQFAIPARKRVFVPSTNRSPLRALKLAPFSICRLPAGTTRLEFVTSGRSVLISSLVLGQPSALAVIVLRQTGKASKTVARFQANARAVRASPPLHSISRSLTKIARWYVAKAAKSSNRHEQGRTDHPFNHYCTKSRRLGRYLAAQTLTEIDARSGYCINPARVRT